MPSASSAGYDTNDDAPTAYPTNPAPTPATRISSSVVTDSPATIIRQPPQHPMRIQLREDTSACGAAPETVNILKREATSRRSRGRRDSPRLRRTDPHCSPRPARHGSGTARCTATIDPVPTTRYLRPTATTIGVAI
ncbi:hypothetical protein BBSC_0637 [Bifidobacterium scardovii JCM 12489 = DSM 13734]|nr:hypothetical protein BBSC_0637 [Bifidobacterium scardovii JCM 12489 = DSM 13734]